LVDNEKLILSSNKKQPKNFTSITDLLSEPTVNYNLILNDKKAILHLLNLGCEKLKTIRTVNGGAGGLIVAASISHAEQILKVLTEDLHQSAVLVSHKIPDAQRIIETFKQARTEWIVSVGMISEGTDIPRLQVCCHLSNIKTELYFRQVLGRILRINEAFNQEAWLYTFAEDNLTGYARQIEKDIPDSFLLIKSPKTKEYKKRPTSPVVTTPPTNNPPTDVSSLNFSDEGKTTKPKISTPILFGIDLLGKYRKEVISVFESPF
jgi:hypothetical protein